MQLRGGVQTLTVTDAVPGTRLRVVDEVGRDRVTVVVDHAGNAHVAFVPDHHLVLDSPEALAEVLVGGRALPPGVYRLFDDDDGRGDPVGTVTVRALDDLPDPSLYDQPLDAGFTYLTVRDGVQLSAMVRFPDEGLYGPAPWPTVIEYSGYSPSDPDAPQPSTLLANLLGFAVVGVNMRGSGCSGGVFDVLSPAQAADGHDVVEIVARQPWVRHGRPGMVGLSYPGISQLFVAATRPPHLAAIAPMSVIDDLWRQQWPGGIYNAGFTRAWLATRDLQTRAGGQAWDQARIEAGDEVAERNQRIRTQNLDFEHFGRSTPHFGPMLEDRRVASLVDRIEVPVYLTGAWQDEQTGSRFALMLQRFTSSPSVRFTLFNGHHPDGYSPMVVARWFEFLSFHVAREVPRVHPLIRELAPVQFQEVFGVDGALEPDRFAHHDDVEAARAEYLAEPPVRLLFESGAGTETPGGAGHRFEVQADRFPPAEVVPRRWWLEAGGRLVDDPPAAAGADEYEDDLDAGAHAYSSEVLHDLDRFTRPQVPIEWTRFDDAHRCAYETAPLDEPLLVAGAGHVDLWLQPDAEDTAVQVTLTEIRPDGTEQRVQCGWHRPAHREEDPLASDALCVDHTYTAAHHRPLTPGEWVRTRVPIYPVAHLFRSGSRVRIALSTPGRDHPFWSFEPPVRAGAAHGVGCGGDHASSLVVPRWPITLDHPEEHPPPDAHRGQPCRPAAPIRNRSRQPHRAA
ncbi:CocE/NonD family hydrolase [Iamia majanohamensis]|uniref:CocE/NonD family hydrolase n=1 Tax=Iamia majanohamensis TaxID=467976 RepID=A0AAE9YDI6_9ACTN|nr:CocE/NonD family hydrolase [Iamia majanohamensis]WCO66812.1 CocE/NonD family hydrolase [Iamia majanohamensis]